MLSILLLKFLTAAILAHTYIPLNLSYYLNNPLRNFPKIHANPHFISKEAVWFMGFVYAGFATHRLCDPKQVNEFLWASFCAFVREQ